MGRMRKIANIENEIEAIALGAELRERKVPHVMRSYHDSAYNGLFQLSAGWGHVEADEQHENEILEVLKAIKQG